MKRTWMVASLLALAPALASAQAGGGAKPPQDKPAPPAPPAPPQGEEKKVPGEAKKIEIGSLVDAATSFTDLDGKTHTLKEFAGKTVVIDFWSIECPVTKGYEARMKKLAADYAKKDVVFLAVNANSTEIGKGADLNKIRDYVKKESIPYTVLLDPGNVVADRLNAQVTPHLFILDKTGKLRYAGGVDDDPEFKNKDEAAVKNFAREALDAVLAGKEPPQTTTKPHGCTIKRVPATG